MVTNGSPVYMTDDILPFPGRCVRDGPPAIEECGESRLGTE